MPRRLFIEKIRNSNPTELAEEYLWATDVRVFATEEKYVAFKSEVASRLTGVEQVSIVGTANWRFSLNPKKDFKEFDRTSDVDVAVISSSQFHLTWNEMRKFHRDRWYQLPLEARETLRRNGENVYSGFASPMWIPDIGCPLKFEHKRLLNKLSNKEVGYRPVKMLFFKNEAEAIDYYKRGFIGAKVKVSKNEL
jgi:hypothetical protein